LTEGSSPSLTSYPGERLQLKAAFEGPGGLKNKQANKPTSKQASKKK